MNASLAEEQIKEFVEGNENTQEIELEFKNVQYIANGKWLGKAVLNISIKDIIYFETLKSKREIKIVTVKYDFIYTESMNRLEEKMKPLGFEISCRGVLVNLEKIMRIQKYTIYLNTGQTVPLSQRRVSEFKERLNEYLHDSFR